MDDKFIPNDIEVEVEVKLTKGGKVLLDKEIAHLLLAIDRTGSLLSASKSLGMPYTKAWRRIARLERFLGSRVIIPSRGGRSRGGASLTPLGEALLDYYLNAERLLARPIRPQHIKSFGRPDLVIIGSHDLLLERIIDEIRKSLTVESYWIGSYGGILSLMMGDSDIAGIHILDPQTIEYNVPIVREFLPKGVALFKGYLREAGWAFRKGIEPSIEKLLEGKLKLANRNKGSGTRILLDNLLLRRIEELGLPRDAISKIKGYEVEYYSHRAACRAVVEGKSDITVSIRAVAEMYGLKFEHICWEHYDFVVREESLSKESVRRFLNILSSNVRELCRDFKGYEIPEDVGKRLT